MLKKITFYTILIIMLTLALLKMIGFKFMNIEFKKPKNDISLDQQINNQEEKYKLEKKRFENEEEKLKILYEKRDIIKLKDELKNKITTSQYLNNQQRNSYIKQLDLVQSIEMYQTFKEKFETEYNVIISEGVKNNNNVTAENLPIK